MTTVADYVDRTVDVSAFQGVTARGEVLLHQALAELGTGGTITTGLNKLGQRFITELLTERGSILYWPERGSTFLTELRAGYVRTQAELLGSFNRALLDVGRNLAGEEADTDPSDERYGTAIVRSVELRPGWASMSVALSSLDPDAQIILPISVTV